MAAPFVDAEAKQALDVIVDQLNALEQWFTEAEKQTAEIEQQIKIQDQAIGRLGEERRASELSLKTIRRSVMELEQERNRLAPGDRGTTGSNRRAPPSSLSVIKRRLCKTVTQSELDCRRRPTHALPRLF
jgi:septal ring factor EnvC (AmiA/AmiB activator)